MNTYLTQHSESCIDGKNHRSIQKVKGIWLGAEKYENKWYEKRKLNQSKYEITYSNWYETFNFESNVYKPCPYMFSDGTWGYGRGRDTTCTSLRLCVICAFKYAPVFTLKGNCENSLSREWNYYMSVNSTNQIEFLKALPRTPIFPFTKENGRRQAKLIPNKCSLM